MTNGLEPSPTSMLADFARDVHAQPDAIEATVAALLTDTGPLRQVGELRHRSDCVVLAGMGTSHAALYPFELRLTEAGVPASRWEASELLHYGRTLPARALVVLASQSGETVEIVRLVERLVGSYPVLGITNNPVSTLARRADVTLVTRAGEEGVVASKTYVTTSAAAIILGAALVGDAQREADGLLAAAAALRRLLDRRDEVTDLLRASVGERPAELFLFGRGPSFATAQAGALILKEASHVAAEGLSGGAFRHGPVEMTSASSQVIAFAPRGRTQSITRQLATEAAGRGARVLLVGPPDQALAGTGLPVVHTEAAGEAYAPLVDVAVPELLALLYCTARGVDPGASRHMGKVTVEE
jgi:glutamine---fructose-6-phosphate transaminase (isomerizing)